MQTCKHQHRCTDKNVWTHIQTHTQGPRGTGADERTLSQRDSSFFLWVTINVLISALSFLLSLSITPPLLFLFLTLFLRENRLIFTVLLSFCLFLILSIPLLSLFFSPSLYFCCKSDWNENKFLVLSINLSVVMITHVCMYVHKLYCIITLYTIVCFYINTDKC